MTAKSLVLIDDLPALPRVSEIYRLLGGREEDAPSRLRDTVDEAMLIGHHLAKPRALYGFFDAIESDEALKNDFGPVALAICTIGADLEEKVRELSKENRLALATALDAVGSETVESLADSVDARICETAAEDGLAAWPRFSPGYGEWPLDSGQRTIFSHLPAERVGVRLSPTFLMNPLKSISFAVKLSTSPLPEFQASRCDLCKKDDCYFRR